MKRIIVTGGAGFIGSAIVWRLNQLGYEDILIVDRGDDTEKWKNLPPLKFADYIDADDFIDDLGDFKDASAIIHEGACSSTTVTDADFMLRNNYQYTKDLAEFAIANDIRFIYASSAATYGDGSVGMNDGTDDLNGLRPLNVYGYSKHLFDQYAARNKMFDSIVGLKYFNVFGPNEAHKGDMRSLVHKAFGQISETGKLKLFKSAHPDYGDGEFGRDFIYVKDVLKVCYWLMQDSPASGIYNLGTGKARAFEDLVKATFAGLDMPAKIDFIDMPGDIRDKYQYFTEADMSKLQHAGYHEPFYSLETGVTDYVRHYLAAGLYY